MTLHDAAEDGDLDELRHRIARGDDVDRRDEDGYTPLMWACISGHHECAQALIDANAAVDVVNNYGRTALMCACFSGRRECARALIDAGAAVDMVDNNGNTSLMKACVTGRHECIRALIDAQAGLELTNRHGKNALMTACVQSRFSRPKAPIRETDFSDRVASLKFACGRLQLIEVVLVVLASTHVIKDAPQLASVRDLQTDAQGVFVNFARDMLIQRQSANLTLDGLAIVCDSST